MNSLEPKKIFYRKRSDLYAIIEKMKLWPSRAGTLHGVKSVVPRGNMLEITTHCGNTFRVYNSRKSRAARWIRNKWAATPCPDCKIPEWKLEKYSKTFFSEHYGKDLARELAEKEKEK